MNHLLVHFHIATLYILSSWLYWCLAKHIKHVFFWHWLPPVMYFTFDHEFSLPIMENFWDNLSQTLSQWWQNAPRAPTPL